MASAVVSGTACPTSCPLASRINCFPPAPQVGSLASQRSFAPQYHPKAPSNSPFSKQLPAARHSISPPPTARTAWARVFSPIMVCPRVMDAMPVAKKVRRQEDDESVVVVVVSCEFPSFFGKRLFRVVDEKDQARVLSPSMAQKTQHRRNLIIMVIAAAWVLQL